MRTIHTLAKRYKQAQTRIALFFQSTPRRFLTMLVGCIILTMATCGIAITSASGMQENVQVVGHDTAPSIIAAEQIQACLASTDANGLDATLINAPQQSKQWDRYRAAMNCTHDALITASEQSNVNPAERQLIVHIDRLLGQYEYTMGQARDHVDGPLTSDQLFQQQILPASEALDTTTYARMNQRYQAHRAAINWQFPLLWLSFLLLLAALGATQWYLFRRTRRMINVGLAAATIVTVLALIYSASVLSASESRLQDAKQHSLDHINALWSARAIAYDMNALESLYMLHYGNAAQLAMDEQAFTGFAHNIVDIDPLQAVSHAEFHLAFGGYLGNELAHSTYPGERDATIKAVDAWAAYITIDSQMRDLMQASDSGQASSFNVRFLQDQSSLAFNQVDVAISQVIAIDQRHFDDQISGAQQALQLFPFMLITWLIVCSAACIFGMKLRLDDYAK